MVRFITSQESIDNRADAPISQSPGRKIPFWAKVLTIGTLATLSAAPLYSTDKKTDKTKTEAPKKEYNYTFLQFQSAWQEVDRFSLDNNRTPAEIKTYFAALNTINGYWNERKSDKGNQKKNNKKKKKKEPTPKQKKELCDNLEKVGEKYYKNKDYESAEKTFETIVNTDGTRSDMWNRLADARRHQGKYKLAIGTYDVAIMYNPNDGDAYAGKAHCLGKTEKWKGCRESYQSGANLGNKDCIKGLEILTKIGK